ncbi:Rieske 2Fe-2S domain-containing protein [Paenibacillus sp. GP183]|uniref:Rieske 2Fe-2S domain-containing protein n=1 Tax=Paenibacillus sp. GP183 TaxID=1882751 RepID=UPI00089C8D0F|nr:Rieske 2Fe-2S domain-containing protein [Paenibacillus sp. GP183]SEB83422.1 menaquinol-cytochrome c reductase iron-sulfur subunit [Paenibacillus sp. GP183]
MDKDRQPQKISRRKFLSTSGRVALGAVGILAGSTGLFYYGSLQQHKRVMANPAEIPESVVKLGELDWFQTIKGVEKIDYEAVIRDAWVTKPTKGFVYVTKDEAGELIVFSPECTHLGCTINPSSETEKKTRSDLLFSCPCHGAQFDTKGNEIRLHLRPLDIYRPIIAGGNVYIDISAPIKRS